MLFRLGYLYPTRIHVQLGYFVKPFQLLAQNKMSKCPMHIQNSPAKLLTKKVNRKKPNRKGNTRQYKTEYEMY